MPLTVDTGAADNEFVDEGTAMEPQPQSIRPWWQRPAYIGSALLLLIRWAGWLPSWAFYPLFLGGFLLILASVLQTLEGKSMERLSTYSRGGALLAFIVATVVTVLAALDSLTRESNILFICGCWFVFGALWLLDTRLSQSADAAHQLGRQSLAAPACRSDPRTTPTGGAPRDSELDRRVFVLTARFSPMPIMIGAFFGWTIAGAGGAVVGAGLMVVFTATAGLLAFALLRSRSARRR